MTVDLTLDYSTSQFYPQIYAAIVHARQYLVGQTITTAGAQVVTPYVNSVLLNNETATIAATIADASKHAGNLFTVKAGLEPGSGQDHTLILTIGTFDGTNNTATFADINDALTVVFDHAGNGTIINNTGSVALSST